MFFAAVHTRMGAGDSLASGRSTFFLEMEETATILRQANKRSLVILDEVGRGTSTHDGLSIAYATLHHLAVARVPTLFVTHYPLLCRLANEQPGVANYHMAFLEEEQEDDRPAAEAAAVSPSKVQGCAAVTSAGRVLFLFQLVRGTAHRSFGLNVARLAELPSQVVERAAVQAVSLEALTAQRGWEAAKRLLAQLAEAVRTEQEGSAVAAASVAALAPAAARTVEDLAYLDAAGK